MTTRALTKTIKDFGAETVSILYTSFPYARDDKYDDIGNSTSPKRKANLANLAVSDAIQDGNNYCITLDLHNPATFNQRGSTKFVNLPIGWLFEEILQKEKLSKTNTILS
jgi:phosphoribosylpyrophosphate synthetase